MSSAIASGSASDGSWGISSPGSSYLLYPPEPQNSAGTWLQATGSALSAVGGTALMAVQGVTTDLSLQSLLQQQIQIQQQMQIYSAQSNISRTEHEMEMTPIRNMRLG